MWRRNTVHTEMVCTAQFISGGSHFIHKEGVPILVIYWIYLTEAGRKNFQSIFWHSLCVDDDLIFLWRRRLNRLPRFYIQGSHCYSMTTDLFALTEKQWYHNCSTVSNHPFSYIYRLSGGFSLRNRIKYPALWKTVVVAALQMFCWKKTLIHKENQRGGKEWVQPIHSYHFMSV